MAASIGIIETDIHFGDTIHITYVYDKPLRPDQALLARADCDANASTVGTGGTVWAQVAILSRGDTDLHLGETPRWQSGGADGRIALIVSTNSRFRTVAKGTFIVKP